MELDEENLNGHWSTDNNTGMDFFIINDAIFSKLCILGDDVEPCFEGSSITAPEVSKTFTKMDNEFKATLYTMMQDLKFALEGGQKMDIDNTETITTEENKETEVVETENAVEEEVVVETEETAPVEEPNEEENSTDMDNEEQSVLTENDNSIEVESNETFAKQEDEEEDKEEEDKNDDSDKEEDNDEKYSLLETEFSELKTSYEELETKYQALVQFKEAVENEKKDALIKSFYMLSDEDKADVIANKSTYSLDEIESKLSVICVRKKVNFDKEEETSKNENVEETATTYNLNESNTFTPAWIAAIRNTRDSKKNN